MSTNLEIMPAVLAEEDDTVAAETGDSAVLHGVPWKLYRKLRSMPENYNLRMTFDRGELVIMSPSRVHEEIARLLGTLIDIWTVELDIQIVGCGAMTIRRSAFQRGFEPDNCYYVQHELSMRGKKRINFKTDPPPDLAIEVEVTRKLSKKTEIYAAFGVPELWRWSGTASRSSRFPRTGGMSLAMRASASPHCRSQESRRSCGSWERQAAPRSSARFATGCERNRGPAL